MQYLLRILEPSATPQTNPQFVDTLKRHAGAKFKANVTWGAYCNPNKDGYFETIQGDPNSVELVEGNKGCDENYYQKSIPRGDDDLFVETFKCDKCNAIVRAFPKLRKFSSVDDEAAA